MGTKSLTASLTAFGEAFLNVVLMDSCHKKFFMSAYFHQTQEFYKLPLR